MAREKVVRYQDKKLVKYNEWRWNLLQTLRERAKEIMRAIPVKSYVHGSVARGDVKRYSDIDIVILESVPSYVVESYVDYEYRFIIQATPNSVIKAVYQVDPLLSISLPLVPMNEREMQFYDFGGKTALSDDRRIMGINKRLLFIEPSPEGHWEWSIIGREYECAKLLKIDVETIRERTRVLTRRDKIGRTGVYLREMVPENKSVEEYLKILADRDPVIRRVVRER